MNEHINLNATLGWNGQLYVLPFDHRANFAHAIFGPDIDPDKLSKAQIAKVKQTKAIIYEGFTIAVQLGLPKSFSAILVDEHFGDTVIKEAIANEYVTAICVEKSGQEEFAFQYGDKFREHITKFNPKIVKALVRYNPEGDKDLNQRQLAKLKELSDYCHSSSFKLLIEPLVNSVDPKADRVMFDKNLRPELTVKMIQEMQSAGVEADIWKIEGMYKTTDYEKVVNQARASTESVNRQQVIVIVLGRAEAQATVETWIKEGAKTSGVEGFAVGRTVFMEPLTKYLTNELTAKLASEAICMNFIHFYNVFKNTKNNVSSIQA